MWLAARKHKKESKNTLMHMFKSSKKFRIAAVLLIAGCIALYLYIFPISQKVTLQKQTVSASTKTAIFANGCFWCVESDFEKLPGVIDAISGYADGAGENPTYQDYIARGFREVAEVYYDPSRVSYTDLVEYMIKHGDPTDGGGSFFDRGYAYSPGIYYDTPEEKLLAGRVIAAIETRKVFDKPLALTVLPRGIFWPAEEYHQDYYKKNPIRYAYYRKGSGRDAFIEKHWSTDTNQALKNEAIMKAPWEKYVKPSDEALRT